MKASNAKVRTRYGWGWVVDYKSANGVSHSSYPMETQSLAQSLADWINEHGETEGWWDVTNAVQRGGRLYEGNQS